MNKNEILFLLSNSYESSNETRNVSLNQIYQYIELNLDQFLETLIIILQSDIEMKLKFLSLSLVRNIYQHFDQANAKILLQKSQLFLGICVSLLQSEIAAQSGATLAEIIIYLFSSDVVIDHIIQQLLTLLPEITVKIGIFEFFSIISTNIDIDTNFYLQIINYIINPQFLNVSNQNDIIYEIQLLSRLISNNPDLFDSDILPQMINFLILLQPIFEYKSSVYLCFCSLIKNSYNFQQIELNPLFYEQLAKDLSNGICIPEISYFLRKSIKKKFESNSSFFFFFVKYFTVAVFNFNITFKN